MKDPKYKIPLVELFFSFLDWANLLERNKKLSLTNVAVAVCIVKIALVPQASLIDIGALMLSIANYAHKRAETNKAIKEQAKQEQILTSAKDKTDLEVAIEKVNEQLKDIKTNQDRVDKVAEEAKQMMTATKLKESMVPTRRQL